MKKYSIILILVYTTLPPLHAFQEEEAFVVANDTVAAPTAYAKPVELVYTTRKFEPGFKEKYRGSDFDYEEKKPANNAVYRFLKKVREFIKSLLPSATPSPPNINVGLIELITKWFLRTLLVFAIVFIITTVIKGNTSWLFARKNKNTATDAFAEENVLETNFATLIAATENEENYRLAIRYYYLFLLQKLTQRGMIKWHLEKTNSDYYYEIYDNRIRNDFKYLSYIYDNVWYGDFELNSQRFLKARTAFNKTINTL